MMTFRSKEPLKSGYLHTAMLRIMLTTITLLIAGVTGAWAQDSQPDTFRVLVWNVWHGTNDVSKGPEKALQLIKDSKADICLLQESYDINGDRPNFGPWAAKQLGWNAWQGKSPHLCVISRYKVKKQFFHAAWHALGVELEDDKGRARKCFKVDKTAHTERWLQA